jgi:hypothetical protein
MTTRREFLKSAALVGTGAIIGLPRTWGRSRTAQYFGLNEFIETHSDAVFIARSNVDVKTNTTAIRDFAHQLCSSLLEERATPDSSIPVNTEIVFKPNVTSWAGSGTPIESTMGIQTDPNFVEGMFLGLEDLGVSASNIYIREANYFAQQVDGQWYSDLALRTGVNMKELSPISGLQPEDIQWVDVPNGIWFTRIPYLWPVNAPGSCLFNIAKLKSHLMGMTLCSKNLQGTNVRPYVKHCTAWNTPMNGVDTGDTVPDAFTTIKANYDRHAAIGIPRWATLQDDPGGASAGGLWQETHATRCLDNNSVIHPLLNMIEGIYGREGPFVSGPDNGYGRDIMTNVVIFGKNSRHVDNIGVYLAGHEPGNFGFFHLAVERGLADYLNPHDIPLYEWQLDGSASLSSLENQQRTPIRTLYLQQPGEDTYHMVDEPYDYAGTNAVRTPRREGRPDAFALSQNYPNPFNPGTSIQYTIPRSGNVRLEVYDIRGAIVDVLVDGRASAGDHLAVWRSGGRAAGTYFYRLLFEGSAITKSMVLLK